jgi:hypothetical protein
MECDCVGESCVGQYVRDCKLQFRVAKDASLRGTGKGHLTIHTHTSNVDALCNTEADHQL